MHGLTGSALQSTGGFENHALHAKVCLERICASDPADCGDRGTLSYYGRRLERGAIGSKLFTFFGCRSALGRHPG